MAEANIAQARRMTEEIGGAQFTFLPIEQIQGRVDRNNWE